MQETRRLLNIEAMSTSDSDAQKLITWLMDRNLDVTSTREIQRLSNIRERVRLNNALEILVEHHYIRLTKDGNKILVHLNPHCM